MAIFKRLEIWLLLFVIAGAVWFVMQPPPTDDEVDGEGPKQGEIAEKSGENETKTSTSGTKSEPLTSGEDTKKNSEPSTVAKSPDRFEIQKAQLVSEDGGSIVEISVIGNETGKTDLSDSNARLVNEDGDQLRRFFVPFDPPPVLEGADSIAELKYWVKGDLEADEKFWLEIDGDRIAVELERR